jgi:hypothetical protein
LIEAFVSGSNAFSPSMPVEDPTVKVPKILFRFEFRESASRVRLLLRFIFVARVRRCRAGKHPRRCRCDEYDEPENKSAQTASHRHCLLALARGPERHRQQPN